MMKKKAVFRFVAVIALVLGCFCVSQSLKRADDLIEPAKGSAQDRAPTGERSYDTPVSADHPALTWFGAAYVTREAFLGFAGDMTGDGTEDLIILYREEGKTDICWMCVAIRHPDDSWAATEPVRAPVENQQLRMYDMDGENPLECVVTGERDGEVGYAIFRMVDGKLTNLFAEGMEDCC